MTEKRATSEATSTVLEALTPGLEIQFDSLDQLTEFEELIAEQIEPDRIHQDDVWATRQKLADLLRPKKIHYTLKNLRLITLENPFDELTDTFKNTRCSAAVEQYRRPRTAGFYVVLDAYSSGKGKVGEAHSRLWLYPKDSQDRYNKHYGLMQRQIEKPKFIKNPDVVPRSVVRSIGFTALKVS